MSPMPDSSTVITLLPWLLPLPALIALCTSLFNLVFWPRGQRTTTTTTTTTTNRPAISVCIPARNEQATIDACVRAALALDVDEVIVIDDGSSDDTPAILAAIVATDVRLRVVRLDAALPAGWVGKVRACWLASSLAHGEHLLFIDADVVVAADAVERFLHLQRTYRADAITAVPRQITVTFVERLILPLLHLTYTSWLPLPLIWRTHNPRFLAANGQLLWLRRDALLDVGGFPAVRGEIVDDMALCRAFKLKRHRVLFVDGDLLGSCRMYRSAQAVIDGFSKNLYEGLGSVVGLVGVVGWYLWAFVAPWALLAVFPVPAAVGVGAALVLRLVHVWRHHSGIGSALLNPIGVLVLMAIAVRSWRWSARGAISWAGRTYAARAAR
ncbi:MAG TPA: glycosyltransferase family 2 protein [Myxococcota bacterium]